MKTKTLKQQVTQNTLKLMTVGSLVLFAATTLRAETYKTADGLDKIKSNLENSKLNKTEYDKNLSTVNANIGEITKAKNFISQQKDAVSGEILKNNESLKKVITQEKEIQQLIAAEKEKLETENRQLQQLEKLTAQIKQNQEKRNAIIADYQNQLNTNQEEKKAWKGRETELRAQEGKTIQSLRGLASEETNWKNKQKGYEIEVKRWSAESEKQQKIFDTYQGLKDEK